MKAVILCAGEGVRMRPLTLTRPKQLIDIAGRPLLEYIFENLPDEVDEVILVIGYLGDQIKEHFGDEYLGRKIQYVWQPKKTGTWYACQMARPLLEKGKFLCMNGDDIVDRAGISSLFEHDLAVLGKEVADPRRFGVWTVDKNRKIIDFVEKPAVPPSNLANTAVYLLDERVFRYAPEPHSDGEYYLPNAVAMLAKDYDMFVEIVDFWVTPGSPADLPRTAEELKAFKARHENSKASSAK